VRFVDHVPDHEVTRLVYQNLPSWHAVGCYFDWRKHYAAEQRKREGIGRVWGGRVLTEQGWVIPSGPLNPRIIDQAGTDVMSPRDIAEQERTDAEVDDTRVEHELAVLNEDMAIFGMQWLAVFEGRKGSGAALRALREVNGQSEQREAFMARWHADHCPG
jgi:hypothetical protein